MRGSRSGVMRVLYGTAMALVGFWAGTAMAAPGDTLWSRTVGTNAFDVVQDAATDANGNLYVVGVTWGDMTGDYKGEGDAFVLKLDPQGRILWRRQPGSAGYDEALGVAIDRSNNVYVVGQTEGAFAGLNKGDDDAFLLKYDTDGRLLWRRQPGTSREDVAWGVAVDGSSNVYMVGGTEGSLAGSNKGGLDIFVLKFDSGGRTLWSRQSGTASNDEAAAVATDAAGNAYVVGITGSDLNGEDTTADAFLFKYNPLGQLLWRRQPGSNDFDEALDVAVDSSGAVYVVGQTSGSLGGPNHGDDDTFILKYASDGRIQWWRQPAAGSEDFAWGVATDASDNVYVVGTAQGAVGGPHVGADDPFVLSYDRNGTLRWSRQPGTTVNEEFAAVAVDKDGFIYAAGAIGGEIDGNPHETNADGLIVKFDRATAGTAAMAE